MKYVATLVGNPARGGLTRDHVARAREIAKSPALPDWLTPDIAADLAVDAPACEAELRAALESEHIDVAVQPAAGRRKRLLVADMDSTVITCECIDEIADFAGLKAEISAITERAMRGELDFADALRYRVSLLRGLPVDTLDRVYVERVHLMPGARALVQTMRRHGAVTALVSGGFTFFTDRVALRAGFETSAANTLESEDGKLTGTVAEPILGREAKLNMLLSLRDRHGLKPEDTLAVGDGANDLGMILEAGLGVAYHAKPVVAAAAGARIDHNDLTALLYLQGYRAGEIVGE